MPREGKGQPHGYAQVIARAWADPEFKKRLLSDTKRVLKESQVDVPEGVDVRAVENTDKVFHLVLPPKPGHLADEQLGDAALAAGISSPAQTGGSLQTAGTAPTFGSSGGAGGARAAADTLGSGGSVGSAGTVCGTLGTFGSAACVGSHNPGFQETLTERLKVNTVGTGTISTLGSAPASQGANTAGSVGSIGTAGSVCGTVGTAACAGSVGCF